MPAMMVTGTIEINNEVRAFKWFYPSIVVKEYLQVREYGPEFLNLAIKALIEANKRVIDKYGFECIDCKTLLSKLRLLKNEQLGNAVVKSIEEFT